MRTRPNLIYSRPLLTITITFFFPDDVQLWPVVRSRLSSLCFVADPYKFQTAWFCPSNLDEIRRDSQALPA
jgi:hypothetical protein